ncbi:MAG: hypothetical protein ACK5MA_05230 [Parachlamydiaceae bacterium]
MAYRANGGYLSAFKGFHLEDVSVQFGYIDTFVSDWGRGGKGYRMIRILDPKGVSGVCALVNSQLKALIFMRLATDKEVQQIDRAIRNGQAKFELDLDLHSVMAILGQQLARL